MASSGLVLALAALAAYRVAYLIAIDEGPFGVIDWVRNRIDPQQRTWVGRGVRCVVCLSFWLALGAAWAIGGGWLEWLGIAGIVLVIHRITNK